MTQVSKAKLSIPKATAREIARSELVAVILGQPQEVVYIHAGAGFGKTTLLAQAAHTRENTVWLTLDGENDVFSFLQALSAALRQVFPDYDFTISEYLLFEGQASFVTTLANAFISSIERLNLSFMMVWDDLHTIDDPQLKTLIACIIKYKPENIRLCLSSREAPWAQLLPLCIRGSILVLTQQELAFTRNETALALGSDDDYIYRLTEGWPLAVGSFRVLLDSGVSLAQVPAQGRENLYAYLFYECVSRLSPELLTFLKFSACFEELDPHLLNSLSGQNNARLLLESLVIKNIFTIKTGEGHFRYHPLFQTYLLENAEPQQVSYWQRQAAVYYFDHGQYAKAAEYAIRAGDQEMLSQIVLINYREYIKSGRFSELRVWFQALGDTALNRELLVAKGAFLSSIGNFTEASTCLDRALPLLGAEDRELYIEAMVHKARVLRNFASFEESNRLLDELIPSLKRPDSELSYSVVIEKIYNLCWNSQVKEALALACQMTETCAQAGNVKVRAWYERYLSVIYYIAGRMKDSVYYYEKSLAIPEDERQYLDMHSVDIYVAKSYQMLGQREKAVSLVTAEIQKLRSAGRYEELWLGYLFAAEIHYQNTAIDRMNGGSPTFETTIKYFTLADEYAPLYRKSQFHLNWTKLQRNIYSLMFTLGDKESVIKEIYEDIFKVGDHFKTIALGRLYNYFGTIGDFASAVTCAQRSIEIGERANTMMVATMSYGFLARVALDNQQHDEAVPLIRRFLLLCHENGIYEYFRVRTAYDPILEFAFYNGIEPEITGQMMKFAGLKIKKAYISTLGGFSVFPYQDRNKPLKMRTKKERELLAFLIYAGSEGVTKEQIYEALWYDSDSDDVKKLIGVNLAHIKNDLAGLGVANPVVNREKHYSICRDEIVADTDLFEAAAQEFKLHRSLEAAYKLIALYKGEYLADFEALWATAKRLRYQKIYEDALAWVEHYRDRAGRPSA